jgi:flagellar basal-body rod protein FlgB
LTKSALRNSALLRHNPHFPHYPQEAHVRFKSAGVITDTSIMNVSPSQFDFLANLLDATSLRHRVVAENIANVNTPGYKALDVSFEQAFQQAFTQGGAEAASNVTGKIIERAGGEERADGNTVDIDKELGSLNKVTMLYNAYMQVLAGQISSMRSAITGH